MIFQESQYNSACSEDPIRKPPRVLVIDDEPAILFAYQKMITAEGFEVDACEKLEQALDFISLSQYSVVISDVCFEGSEYTDGIRVLHTLRTRQPDVRVIIVTGYGNDEIEHALKKLDFPHYFEKPVKPASILALLKMAHTAI